MLNVTPDSFSDGGHFLASTDAVGHGLRMRAAGADCIDIGGASSRPRGATYGDGAAPVGTQEEIDRVVPVIEGLAARCDAPLSVDTCRAAVASAALAAGARIVNDVSGGADPELLREAARCGAELVLMHTRGDGAVASPNTDYADAVHDVVAELGDAIARAQACGVSLEKLWIDPGLGFAKTPAQSLQLLDRLPELCGLGHRVLVGASRKGFIGQASLRPDGSSPGPDERDPGTFATVALSVRAGANAVRVHDVAGAYQAVRVTEAVVASRGVAQ